MLTAAYWTAAIIYVVMGLLTADALRRLYKMFRQLDVVYQTMKEEGRIGGKGVAFISAAGVFSIYTLCLVILLCTVHMTFVGWRP